MKKLILTLAVAFALNFTSSNANVLTQSCTVSGGSGSVTVSCECTHDEACTKAIKAYNAIQ